MPLDDYLALVLGHMQPLDPLTIPVGRLQGLVTAESVFAPHDIPMHDELADEGSVVRRAGEDLAAGSVANSRSLAMIAMCGRRSVLAHPRVRVSILCVGDELVEDDRADREVPIVNCNAPMLAAAARALGCEVRTVGPVADTRQAFLQGLRNATKGADLVLTTGGTSDSAHDLVRSVLEPMGGFTFTQVAMKPGVNQAVGVFAGVPILAFPGNPVSAYVSFVVLGVPAIRRLQGHADPGHVLRRATLRAALSSPADMTQFARGILQGSDALTVTPVRGQGARHVSGLAHATCLIVIPAGVESAAADSTVQVIDLRGLDRDWRIGA